MLPSLEGGGQAPPVLKLGPGFVSLRPQQAPLGHRWHHCLDLRTPKARKRRCSRPPPLGPAGGLGVGGMSGHPPSGGAQRGSRLPFPPNAPTPRPKAALLHREAAPGSYRSETGAAGGGGAKAGCCCVCLGAGGETPQTLPAHHPALGPRLHARHRLEASLRRAPPSPGGGQAARPGNCPPGATSPAPRARLGLLPPSSRPTPSAPGSPRLPGRAWLFPRTPGGESEPGLRRSGRRALSPAPNGAPSHAGPRAPTAGGGRYPSPHPGRRRPPRTLAFPLQEATSLRKTAPTPEREPPN